MTLLRCLPRFRKAYRAMEIYQERESWSRWKIESFQLDRINALWQQAVRHVPYYQISWPKRHCLRPFSVWKNSSPLSRCCPVGRYGIGPWLFFPTRRPPDVGTIPAVLPGPLCPSTGDIAPTGKFCERNIVFTTYGTSIFWGKWFSFPCPSR